MRHQLSGSLVIIALLVGAAWVGGAEAQVRFGRWGVVPANDGSSIIAATTNDSGQILGQGCWYATAECIWLIALDIACIKDQKGHVLANTDTGTIMLDIYCLDGAPIVSSTRYRYAFTDFDKIDHLVRGNSIIGFAMALKSGGFQVVRFHLSGAAEAVTAMRNAAQERSGTSTWRTTRDKRL